MGRPMGEPEPPIKDTNVQKIASDPTTSNDTGVGTNFEHTRKQNRSNTVDNNK